MNRIVWVLIFFISFIYHILILPINLINYIKFPSNNIDGECMLCGSNKKINREIHEYNGIKLFEASYLICYKCKIKMKYSFFKNIKLMIKTRNLFYENVELWDGEFPEDSALLFATEMKRLVKEQFGDGG